MNCSFVRLTKLKSSFWVQLLILILFCVLLLTIIGFTRWKIDIWPPSRLLIKIINEDISRPKLFRLGSDVGELNQLSLILLQEIESFETGRNCTPPFLKCGLFYPCGLGCQIHHRALCLMTAFVLNFTLIHEYNRKWPFNKKWPEEFQHMMSDCDTSNQPVYNMNWRRSHTQLIDKTLEHNIEFPFNDGIPMSATLLDKLENLHTDPALWWMSHFVHYAMDLLPSEKKKIDDLLGILQTSFPIVGLHIRRTDKIAEMEKSNITSFHDLKEYMVHVENFYANHSPPIPFPWRIFIASEDIAVFKEFKEQYALPKWLLLGFPPVMTTKTWKERADFLDEIIRDVIMLSRCDLVVCGFSSNICRLVYEFMQVGPFNNRTFIDSTKKVISIDKPYLYNYFGHALNTTIVK